MADKRKILIVGGTGYVGSSIAQFLAPKFEITCTYRKDFTPMDGVNYFGFGDISDKDKCKALMQKFAPDIVFYTAGGNDSVAAERDVPLTQYLHSTGPSVVMTAADYIKSKFIYISSDWVFAGTEGNYSETDTAMPYSQIGKAKLGAENYIRNRSGNHVIIRSAPLLGRGTLQHPSWLDVIREHQLSKKKISIPHKSKINPVHISQLLFLIEKVLEQDVKNKTFHLGGLTKTTPYEVAQAFLKKFNYDLKLIEKSDDHSSPQENDFSLNFTQSIRSFKTEPLLLEQSLDLLE